MRRVRLKQPHNRRVRRGARRSLETLPAGSEITVTEREFQALRDRFIEIGTSTAGSSVSGDDRPDENVGSNGAGDAPDLEQLRREAADLGIDVDTRWREKRLMQEIERALSATA